MPTGILSAITEGPFIPDSFKALCVFQVALETESLKAFALCHTAEGVGEKKVLRVSQRDASVRREMKGDKS